MRHNKLFRLLEFVLIITLLNQYVSSTELVFIESGKAAISYEHAGTSTGITIEMSSEAINDNSTMTILDSMDMNDDELVVVLISSTIEGQYNLYFKITYMVADTHSYHSLLFFYYDVIDKIQVHPVYSKVVHGHILFHGDSFTVAPVSKCVVDNGIEAQEFNVSSQFNVTSSGQQYVAFNVNFGSYYNDSLFFNITCEDSIRTKRGYFNGYNNKGPFDIKIKSGNITGKNLSQGTYRLLENHQVNVTIPLVSDLVLFYNNERFANLTGSLNIFSMYAGCGDHLLEIKEELIDSPGQYINHFQYPFHIADFIGNIVPVGEMPNMDEQNLTVALTWSLDQGCDVTIELDSIDCNCSVVALQSLGQISDFLVMVANINFTEPFYEPSFVTINASTPFDWKVYDYEFQGLDKKNHFNITFLQCEVPNHCFFKVMMDFPVDSCTAFDQEDKLIFFANCSEYEDSKCQELSSIYFSVDLLTHNETLFVECNDIVMNFTMNPATLKQIYTMQLTTEYVNNTLILMMNNDTNVDSVYFTLFHDTDIGQEFVFREDFMYNSSQEMMLTFEGIISIEYMYTVHTVFYNNETFMAISSNFTLFNITSKSLKKYFINDLAFKLYDTHFEVELGVLLVQFADTSALYNWTIIPPVHSHPSTSLVTAIYPIGCYNVFLNVSSPYALSAISRESFCVLRGINITFDVNHGQTFGSDTIFYFRIEYVSNDSCIFLDPGDPNVPYLYGLYNNETEDFNKTKCQNQKVNDKAIQWHSWQSLSASGDLHNITLRHFYPSKSTYSTTLHLNNEVHQQTIDKDVTISPVICESPSEVIATGLGISEHYPVEIYTTDRYRLESFSKINCFHSSVTKTQWNIYDGYYFDHEVNTELEQNSSIFSILPFSIPIGFYKVCVTVLMEADESFQATNCGFLLINETPLIAHLNGGDVVIRSHIYDYTLDASEAIDPDTNKNDDILFYYICRDRNDAEFTITKENIEAMEFALPYLSNPNYPNFDDKGGCYGTGPGRLYIPTTNTMTVLPSEFLVHDKELEVTLFMWKQGVINRTATFTQHLTISSHEPPSMRMKCITNCNKMINLNEAHTFLGDCAKPGQCEGDIKFEWFLDVCETELENCVPDTTFENIRITNKTSLFYDVKANSYLPNKWYRLTLRGCKDGFCGENALSFSVNEPPKDGQCTINPHEEESIFNEFRLSCTGWVDGQLPLTYKFYVVDEDVQKVLYHGFLPALTVTMPSGNVESDYMTDVSFAVIDNLNAQTIITQSLKIEPRYNKTDLIPYLFETIKDETSLYNVLIASDNILPLSNLLLTYASLMNDYSQSLEWNNGDNGNSTNSTNSTMEGSSDSFNSTMEGSSYSFNITGLNSTNEYEEALINDTIQLIKLREILFDQALQLDAITMNGVRQYSSVLTALAAQSHEISMEYQTKIIGKVKEYCGVVKADASSGSAEDLVSAFAGMTESLGKVQEISGLLVDVLDPDNVKLEAIKKLQEGTNYTHQALVQPLEINEIFDEIRKYIGGSAIPGGSTKGIVTGPVSLASKKLLPGEPAAIEVGGVGAKFDASQFVTGGSGMDGASNFMNVAVKKTKTNPFVTDESAANVKSQITSIEFSTKDGDAISVNNTESPIEITIANILPEGSGAENKSLSVDENGDQWMHFMVEMKNLSFKAVIEPRDNVIVSFKVFFRLKKRSTLEKYDYMWSLPDSSSCTWKDESNHGGEAVDVLTAHKDEYTCPIHPYSVFISAAERLHGNYYLTVYYQPNPAANTTASQEKRRRRRATNDQIDVTKVDEEYCVLILPPPPTPVPTDPPGAWLEQEPVITNDSLRVSLITSQAECLFWNETEQAWGNNGCEVGPETTAERTQCLCTHLTNFGGDVMVAPNPIDFDKVFAGLKNLGDNLGVFMVILTILLLYVILVVWSRKKDRRDELEKGNITIDCRRKGDKGFSYLATLVTGAGRNSGTTANVYCILSGEDGESKPIPLKVEGRKTLQARSITTYKFILPKYLGELVSVRVFHDNTGLSPSWYLRNICITDLSDNKQYPFVCDSWLAVDSIDGEIEKLLPIANEKDLAGFHIVFASTAAEGLLDGHIWFSIFTRPKNSTFTRVQRLSSCLLLIFLTMITNAMFFGAGERTAKKILRLGNMKINLTGLIIGIQASIIVIPPSMLVIEIFRRLKPKNSNNNQTKRDEGDENRKEKGEIQKKNKGPFLFPNQFKYLAYTVIFLGSLGSSMFTFFYSLMWGPVKSNQWLGSMFFGFFQSVLVIQPIKAVFMAVLFAIFLRKPVKQLEQEDDDDDEGEEGKNENEDDEDDIEGDDGIITADEVPIIRPSESAIARARKAKLKEKMSTEIIKDIATYFVFLMVVTYLAYSERDPNMFLFREDLKNMLDGGKYTGGLELNQVSDLMLLYSWLQDTVLPSIFSGPWYNEELPKEPGFINNHETLLISIPRIRQQRVKPMSCKIHSSMTGIVHHCDGAYSSSNEEKGDYSIFWDSFNSTSRKRRSALTVDKSQLPETFGRFRRNTVAEETQYQSFIPGKEGSLRRRKKVKGSIGKTVYYVSPRALLPDGTILSCKDRWEHFTASDLRGFPFFGRLVTYGGGGYVANLGYNEETALTVLADLHAHAWLSRQTRAVFVEFTVYNANVNLFATSFLFIEVLPTGGAYPYAEFKVFNGYRYSLNSNLSSRLVELVFVIFVVFFTVRELRKMYKQRFEYVKSFFNIIEIILIPLYIIMFGLIIIRWLSTAANIREFKENPKDFVSFQYSAEADAMLQGVMGVLAFLLNIKFLRLFQFSKDFYRVGLIMKGFMKPLFMFSISFGICFFLFAAMAHLAFAAASDNYLTFMRAIVAQFLHLLGTTDFDDVRSSHYVLGPLYYVTYSLFMLFVLFNVFMAIICDSIDGDYEEELMEKIGDIRLVEFMVDKLKRIITMSDDPTSFYEQNLDDDDPVEAMNDKMTKLENAIEQMHLRIMALDGDSSTTNPDSELINKEKSDTEGDGDGKTEESSLENDLKICGDDNCPADDDLSNDLVQDIRLV